jgi:hypothetical protein
MGRCKRAFWIVAAAVVWPALPAPAGDVRAQPDFVWFPVSIGRGEQLRVCLRHVARPGEPGAAEQPELERSASWQVEATAPDGEPLLLSEPAPLPAPGEFRCTELARRDLAVRGQEPVNLGVGVLLDAAARDAVPHLLPSMRVFEQAANRENLHGGDWVGRGADKFYNEQPPASSGGASACGPAAMVCEPIRDE